MKKIMFSSVSFILLIYALTHTDSAMEAAREGMNLWLNTLIPTLLPFIILTGILLKTEMIEKILTPLRAPLQHLFGLTPCGGYALFAGLLCGYPMGAKITSDLYRQKKISLRESNYLMTFSNNASPGFLMGYLYLSCLKKSFLLWQILFPLFLGNLFVMLFFRFLVFQNHTYDELPVLPKKETSSASGYDAFVDVSIMNGFETMARLGGYILIFSLAEALLRDCLPSSNNICYLLSGSMELTNGLHRIAASSMHPRTKHLYSMLLTSFGGFCITAQTKSVCDPHVSMKYYFSAKCINALITAVFILFFRKII